MWRDALLYGFGISIVLMALALLTDRALKLAPLFIKRETWSQRLRRELGYKEDL